MNPNDENTLTSLANINNASARNGHNRNLYSFLVYTRKVVKGMRDSRTASSDMTAWCSAVVLLSLILLLSVRENNASDSVRGSQFSEKPCEEIYVVGEGETLHTIGNKCGDPFIVERNPHIHDPDDVFPGLVLRIAPFYFSRKVKHI
ncbi:hypothetical protein Bca101_041962 [Brassica carinata]